MLKGWEFVYQRKSSVRLRRTAFGGAAFLSDQATTVELEPHNGQWYAANALSAQDSLLLLRQMYRLEPLFAETQLTVDCAFSYLFYDLTETELAA